ncbi:MAG: CHAT domain-containing protein, partial [Blastochloris sp.]|nr:CHAT domain-containing protein [Blastochloris sp.]
RGPHEHGHELGRMIFLDELLEAFNQARVAATRQKRALRLRLAFSLDATELQAIPWETLVVPGDQIPLVLSERVLVTRTLGSNDWQPVKKLRAKDKLKALVVIVAPADLETYQLATIDVIAEKNRAVANLNPIPATVLAEPGQATLNAIISKLRKGYDLLYLVAHGKQKDDDFWLFLDNGDGQTQKVRSSEFVARLMDPLARPRLILLASCESAGDGTTQALTAMGPSLVRAGIPAVIAMQGRFSIETNQIFVPSFFQEIQHDGKIDRALAVARQKIAKRSDWWMPVLFTRLRSGRIWYEPGFEGKEEFKKWPSLVNNVIHGKCTPILGPGLLEGLIGSTNELAKSLAVKHRFPFAPGVRDDLPSITQYLAIRQDTKYMQDELKQALRDQVEAYTGDDSMAEGSIDEILSAAGARQRAKKKDDPHRILSKLPLPLFLTANTDQILEDALREEGKDPQVLICSWNKVAKSEPPTVKKSREEPLVYHLFGRLNNFSTMVITEDDYFRYLTGVTRNETLPGVVGSALVETALIFLGFQLRDWNFRVLFQSIMDLEGREMRRDYTHVAVQIDPQEEDVLDPSAVREYLKMYFGQTTILDYQTNITIYWGSAEDFLRELYQRVTRQMNASSKNFLDRDLDLLNDNSHISNP